MIDNDIIALIIAWFTYVAGNTIKDKIRGSVAFKRAELQKLVDKSMLHELRTMLSEYAILVIHNGGTVNNNSLQRATCVFHYKLSELAVKKSIIAKSELLFNLVTKGSDSGYIAVNFCKGIMIVIKEAERDIFQKTEVKKVIDRYCYDTINN